MRKAYHKGAYGPPKSRPCNSFTKDGRPINGGCRRSSIACHYIHPDDPEWSTCPDTREFNEDERERDHGWATRRRRPSNPSPGLPATTPTFALQNTTAVQPMQNSTPLPEQETDSAMEADSAPPVSPEHRFMPTPIFLGPPPTIPDVPGFDEEADILGSAPEISETRRKMWNDRLHLLMGAVKAFAAHHDFLRGKVILDSLQDRPGLSIGDGGETILDAFRAALDVQSKEEEELKKKVDEMVDKVVARDLGGTADSVWPMTPAQLEHELAMQDKYKEMLKYIKDLRNIALKVWEALDDKAKQGLRPPEAPILSEMSASEPSDAMEVDTEQLAQQETQSRKKRKLNDGQAEDLVSTLLDKIKSLDASLSKLDTLVKQDEQRAIQTMDEIFEARFEQLRENETHPEYLAESDLSRPSRQRLADLEQGIAKADMKVKDSVKDLQEIGERLNALTISYPAAVSAYNAAVQRHEANEKKITKLFNEQMETQKAIDTLQNAFRTLTAQKQHRQPSPPASPGLPSCEVVVDAVEQRLRDHLREGLREVVEQFRLDVKRRMAAEVDLMIEVVASKVLQTLDIIVHIEQSLERLSGPS